MASLFRAFVAAMFIAVAACTTLPMAPPTRELTQELSLRSDPAGAHCSILQQSVVVASVDTPGTAKILRRNVPIEVVCQKEGYLEQSIHFPTLPRWEVEYAQSTTNQRVFSGAGLFFLGLALYPLPLYLPEPSESSIETSFGYGSLPPFFLVPATFDSEAARDNFFTAWTAKLEQEANEERSIINQRCHYWPCTPSDTSCQDPVCERQRRLVEDQLKTQLDQIPEVRARTTIRAPSP